MTGHSHVLRRRGGFTMVELVVVMVLAGILAAVGISRFFDRAGYDADAFTEQTRAMLRYAQKLAIAGNRPVFVSLDAGGIALCLEAGKSCVPASRLPAPSGANSGSSATSAYCGSPSWYCEARPATVTWSFSPASFGALSFDALGRPSVAGLTISIGGDGATRTVSIAPETGYVY